MTKLKYITVLFIVASFFTSCAKRGTITGGPKDTIAPKIVGSFPENFSTNFKGNEIKINFNELIKVKDITKQLIISPPMKKQPVIVPQGSASKFISIKILDTLQENTTYSFNFGQSISDNNENNPYSQFKYVFSTGSYIDSLTVVGKIKDAYNQKPDAPAVLGYDGARLIADAISRAGGTDAAKVAKAIAETKNYKAVTGDTSLNETHDAVKSAVIIEFKDGKQAYRATVKP